MFAGFVSMVVTGALVRRPHGKQASIRRPRHGECGSQQDKDYYREEPFHIPILLPTSPTLYLYPTQSSSPKLGL